MSNSHGNHQEAADGLEKKRAQAEAKLEDVKELLELRGRLPDGTIKNLIRKVVDPEHNMSDFLD